MVSPATILLLLLYFISFFFFLQDKTISCEIHFVLLEAVPQLTLPKQTPILELVALVNTFSDPALPPSHCNGFFPPSSDP